MAVVAFVCGAYFAGCVLFGTEASPNAKDKEERTPPGAVSPMPQKEDPGERLRHLLDAIESAEGKKEGGSP